MGSELLQWFFIFSILALFMIARSRKQLKETNPSELLAALNKDIYGSYSLCELKEKLLKREYRLYFEEKEKLIVESKKIGFFHWGFLYILTCKENGLRVGIFPKGPNPPRKKVLEKYLDLFIQELEGVK